MFRLQSLVFQTQTADYAEHSIVTCSSQRPSSKQKITAIGKIAGAHDKALANRAIKK